MIKIPLATPPHESTGAMDSLTPVSAPSEGQSSEKSAWATPRLIVVDMAGITLSNSDNIVDGPVDNHS